MLDASDPQKACGRRGDGAYKRSQCSLFVSPVVLLEIADGDPGAAAKRLEAARGLPVLPEHPEAMALAVRLAAEVPIPDKTKADAAHLALAAFHGMDYLVTWNQTHLDNTHLRSKIEKIIKEHGLTSAQILTPERIWTFGKKRANHRPLFSK